MHIKPDLAERLNGLYKYHHICFITGYNFNRPRFYAEEQKEQILVLTMFVGGDGHP